MAVSKDVEIDGDFDSIGGSAAAYAWFVREKGFKGGLTERRSPLTSPTSTGSA